LPSNLRSTTRECVHFVTHSHLRSRDKGSGHIPYDPKLIYTLHTNFMCYRSGVIADQSITLQE